MIVRRLGAVALQNEYHNIELNLEPGVVEQINSIINKKYIQSYK